MQGDNLKVDSPSFQLPSPLACTLKGTNAIPYAPPVPSWYSQWFSPCLVFPACSSCPPVPAPAASSHLACFIATCSAPEVTAGSSVQGVALAQRLTRFITDSHSCAFVFDKGLGRCKTGMMNHTSSDLTTSQGRREAYPTSSADQWAKGASRGARSGKKPRGRESPGKSRNTSRRR